MNVLIVGSNGFVGRAVAQSAASQGLEVSGLSRSNATTLDADVRYFRGDRKQPNEVLELVRNHKIDVLVDVIPMTLGDTQPLLDCIDQQVHQYVMVSSCDVYRNYELLQRKSTGTPTLAAVSENSELRQTRFPYREESGDGNLDGYLYNYDKIPIELATMEMLSRWTILRLPMIYGPGDKQRRFRWAIEPMLKGRQKIVIPSRWANWVSTYSYIANVAEGIALTLGNPKAENQTYNIGEPQWFSQLEWAQHFADALGWQGEIEQTDDPSHPFAQSVAGLDLSIPFKVSSRHIRQQLGYQEPIDRVQTLARTVASETSL